MSVNLYSRSMISVQSLCGPQPHKAFAVLHEAFTGKIDEFPFQRDSLYVKVVGLGFDPVNNGSQDQEGKNQCDHPVAKYEIAPRHLNV